MKAARFSMLLLYGNDEKLGKYQKREFPLGNFKGAGTSETPGQTKEELSANDTSRHPKVLKIGPNHGCQ